MLSGNDISEFQGQIDFGVYKNNSNFLIAKASEGTSYIDHWFGYNRSQSRLAGLPFGSYHFARPDIGNTPEAEAKFYCSLIDGDQIQEGEILCLDFEVTYNDCVNWCKKWLDYVSNHFGGMKPYIYLNQAQTKGFDWSPVVNAGYPLWLASYQGIGIGDTGKWSAMTMQQWTSSQKVPGITGNVDGDWFYGDLATFKSLGYKKPVVISTPTTTSATTQPAANSNTSTTTTTSTTTPPTIVQPPAVDCSIQNSKLKQLHDIYYGKGFWWVKWTNIGKLLPK